MSFQPYGGPADRTRPGACAVVLDGAGRVLLQRRADNGHWNLPGGGLELGESLAACCAREVLEETGLTVEIVRLTGVYSDPAISVIRYPDGEAVQFVAAVFECRVLGGELRADHESLELGWFDPAAPPEPFSPNHRPRLRDALERREAAFWR